MPEATNRHPPLNLCRNPESRKRGRIRLAQAAGMQELLDVWEKLSLPGLPEWRAKVARQTALLKEQEREANEQQRQPDYGTFQF